MSKLQIYKASAGSGKTYLLTGMFLHLAFDDPNNFNKILAVTFTNKATEEMKVRILSAIDDIISKGDKADHFKSVSEFIKEDSVDIIINKAKTIRNNILHNYTVFNISTIDSFVQKIIRSFAYEMNLNSTYSIEMDTDKVIEDLTEILYEKVSEDKFLKERIIQFVDFKINEGKSWDFRSELKEILKEIFKERFHSLNSSTESTEISDFLKLMHQIINKFESDITKLSEKYVEIIETEGIDYNNLGNKFMTISNHFIKKFPIKDFKLTKTLEQSIQGEENWYVKNPSKEVLSAIKSVYNEILILIKEFFKIINEQSLKYNTAKVIIRNIHSLSLIKDITALLPDYRNDNNILFISDTSVMLKEIIGNNDAPFIYEKIGNQFKHILIDEFQDTSDFQWFNFRPLIENSLAQGFYNLIVGDIKQAIYRWRNGDWRLLLSGVKESVGDVFIEEKSLNTNWRSKENIILFNNVLFDILPDIVQNVFNASYKNLNNETLKKDLISAGFDHIIKEAYRGHFQKVPKSKSESGGHIEINFYENMKTNEEYLLKLSEELPLKIDKILQNGKYLPKDITILVRTNKEAKEIVDMLMNFLKENPECIPYQVISPDSLYMKNSRSVRIIIAAMKFCIDKEDQINNAHLIHEFGYLNDLISERSIHEIFTKSNTEELLKLLPKEFIENNDKFLELSLFEFSDRIIDIFELNSDKSEYPFIMGLQDLISEQSRKWNPDITDFIDWWDKNGKSKSIQSVDNNQAVTVMTVHKAKGLAFKVVMLPFAKWSLGHSGKGKNLIWTNTKVEPFNRIGNIPLDYSMNLAETVFGKDYFNETLMSYIDNLNVLYVALTRAKDELYVFSTYSDKKKEINNIGDLLYSAVNQEYNDSNLDDIILHDFYNQAEHNFIYNSNNEKKYDLSDDEIVIESVVNEFSADNYPTEKIDEKFKIKLSSEDFFIESIKEIEDKVNYGILMHKVFSEIQTEDDVEDSIQSFIYQGYITKQEGSELKQKIYEIIKRPVINKWFSKEFKVKNEEALITERGDVKIPDRVLIGDSNAIVIDFKFGKKQEKYIKQISEYKSLIEGIYNKDTEAFIFYVEENDIIEV